MEKKCTPAILALMGRILFRPCPCIWEKKSGSWLFPDSWTPDCEKLMQWGYAYIICRPGRGDLGDLHLGAKGCRALLLAVCARMCELEEKEED